MQGKFPALIRLVVYGNLLTLHFTYTAVYYSLHLNRLPTMFLAAEK